MRLISWLVAIATAVAIPASAQSPTQLVPTKPTAAVLPTAAPPATSATSTTSHDLTKADVDAWLDGYMPYALEGRGHSGRRRRGGQGRPAADDARLRLFGSQDRQSRSIPNLTLFRPGSVSKLFTWTAVMQQVQAGKLNLDADVNTYLDFKIPPQDGKPITLRNLMTHTPGSRRRRNI